MIFLSIFSFAKVLVIRFFDLVSDLFSNDILILFFIFFNVFLHNVSLDMSNVHLYLLLLSVFMNINLLKSNLQIYTGIYRNLNIDIQALVPLTSLSLSIWRH